MPIWADDMAVHTSPRSRAGREAMSTWSTNGCGTLDWVLSVSETDSEVLQMDVMQEGIARTRAARPGYGTQHVRKVYRK